MNFQNIPRKDKLIKAAFVPKLDALFFFDYKSIEPRLTAYYLAQIGFPKMRDMFINGVDLYVETAKMIFGQEEIEDEERQVAKIMFLSQTYGGGIGTLMLQLGEPANVCFEYLKRFHQQWPELGKETRRQPAEDWTLLGRLSRALDQKGYIETLGGRRLVPESPHKRLNTLIQGGAAFLMRSALIKIHRFATANNWESHLVSTVHDEAILDVLRSEIPDVVQWVPELMRYYPVHEVVPMEVDVEYSFTSWAEKEAWSSGSSVPDGREVVRADA
jgi:DNA polymerase I